LRIRLKSFPFFLLPLLAVMAVNIAGCANTVSTQPTFFDTLPELFTKKYSSAEITAVRQNFKIDPPQYSQALGEMLLWQMNKKSPETAKEFARIPDLNDGIDSKEAKAIISICNLIKDLNIPLDFFEAKPGESAFHSDDKTGLTPELFALREMILVGKGDQKYSALLQALLWGYMDGYFQQDNNPLKNYQGALKFVKPIWGSMEGPRWEKFEDVVRRLNTSELINYYERKNFTYEFYDSGNWVGSIFVSGARPSLIFEKKQGNCDAYSTFTEECLRRAGYETWIKITDIPEGEHATVLFKDKGGIYLFDNAYFQVRCSGIIGPFKSENEAIETYFD